MESFLNISGEKQLLDAVHRCYASLFTDRAIKYRHDMGFTNMDIAISVGVQQMVRSDKASSGVAFTIDPDSGFKNTIVINGTFGLGENIVQGRITPDEWMVFKPTLYNQKLNPILKSRCGNKEFTMIYSEKAEYASAEKTIVNIDTPLEKQNKFSLSRNEVVKLAQWCQKIENHYKKAMDIEWAKDGLNDQLYIVQARPETIHGKERKQDRRNLFPKRKKQTADKWHCSWQQNYFRKSPHSQQSSGRQFIAARRNSRDRCDQPRLGSRNKKSRSYHYQ